MLTRRTFVGGTIALGFALASTAAFAQTTLKLAHVWPPTEIHAKAAEIFAEDVKKATDGKVVVQIFGGSTLGNDRELVEGLKLGTVDIWVGGSGVLNAASETARIFTVPFLFDDGAHFRRVYDGAVGGEITKRIRAESGYEVVSYWFRGARWLTTRREVRTPADLAGLKIRVPDSPVFVRSFQRLGAAPTPMGFSEVFTALQQGVIDGQENPLSLIVNARLNEVTKFLVKTEHVLEPIAMVMDSRRLQRLPEAQRKVVVDAANGRAKAYVLKEVVDGDKVFLDQLRAGGMTLIEPDLAAFRAKLDGFVDAEFPKLRDVYGQIRAAAKTN